MTFAMSLLKHAAMQANEMRANAAKLKKESEEAKTKFVDTEKPVREEE